MQKKIFVLFGFFFLLSGNLTFSQELNIPLSHEVGNKLQAAFNKTNDPVCMGFKPVRMSEIENNFNVDSVVFRYTKDRDTIYKFQKNIVFRKLFCENFIEIRKKNYVFIVNPIFYIEYTKSSDSSKIFSINSRGLEIKGTLGNKLAYYTSFTENQAFFRPYISQRADERLVAPGQGAHKVYKETGYDFSGARSYLSYAPAEFFSVQIGYDKHFVGEGYRSLLLSDNAFQYPYFRFDLTGAGFKYTSMFTQFQDFEKVYYDRHVYKHAAINYLAYSYKNHIEIGFFEGMIFQTTDTAEYINKFPADYFVPIIGYHTAKYGFQSRHNLLTGADLKIRPHQNFQIYAQIALENPKEKIYAHQFGIKTFDLFFGIIRKQNLFLQVEYNNAPAQMYCGTDKWMAWGNYNQELAHPLGNSFREIFTQLNYGFYKFNINVKFSKAMVNTNNTASDIFGSQNSVISDLPENTIIHKTITIDWMRHPKTYFALYIGADFRTSYGKETAFIFGGFKTALSNFYYDF